MTSAALWVAGLAALLLGVRRVRRVPDRSDEERWHGFLLLFAAAMLLLCAYGSQLGD